MYNDHISWKDARIRSIWKNKCQPSGEQDDGAIQKRRRRRRKRIGGRVRAISARNRMMLMMMMRTTGAIVFEARATTTAATPTACVDEDAGREHTNIHTYMHHLLFLHSNRRTGNAKTIHLQKKNRSDYYYLAYLFETATDARPFQFTYQHKHAYNSLFPHKHLSLFILLLLLLLLLLLFFFLFLFLFCCLLLRVSLHYDHVR